MDRDQIDKATLVKRLSEFDTVACKICLEKKNDEWQVTHIIGDLNIPNSGDSIAEGHAYTDVTFIRDVVPTEEFCKWISELKGKLQNLDFQLPEPRSQIQQERYPTGIAINHFYRLPFPYTLYTLSTGGNEGRQSRLFLPLVKSGLPSFPNYETAFYRFMLNRPYGPGQAIPDRSIVIRIAHPEAWISAVEAEADAVTIVLEGEHCEGTQLTVGSSDGVVVNERIKSKGAQRFELRDANFDHFWVVLSRDDSWVDWRDNRGDTRRTTWDVSGVQPGNLAAHIEQLLLQGENEWLEYKVKIPDQEDKFLKTVAAFANGGGGIILVGVTDDGKVEGVPGDLGKLNDSIVNSIRNRITPQPIFQLQSCEVDHRHVLAVFIQEGQESPYGLNTKPPSIYVRRHGTTFDATPGEIRALGAKNQPTPGLSYGLKEY